MRNLECTVFQPKYHKRLIKLKLLWPNPSRNHIEFHFQVKSSVAGLGSQIKCAAEDLYAEQQLSDKRYIRQQLECVLNRGPCDKNGALIRSKFCLGSGIMKPFLTGFCMV